MKKMVEQRNDALENLMKVSYENNRYKVNIDFISKFQKFFVKETNSQNFIKDCVEITKGKTGWIYSILDRLILKQIRNVRYYEFLPLKVINCKPFMTEIYPSIDYNALEMVQNNSVDRYYLQVATDNFTNQTIIHLILNYVLKESLNYLYQFDCFFCDRNGKIDGYNLTEKSNLNDLSSYILTVDEITESFFIDMIRQILTPLVFLKQEQFGFLHSDLKTKNIFVHRVKGKIYYKIADFDKSSIFFNRVRFFNHQYNYLLGYYQSNPFPVQEGKYYCLSDCGWIGKYIGFHEYIMSSPFGFYLSFDIYTLFYSIILEHRILDFLMQNKNLGIWKWYEFLFEKDWESFKNHIDDIYHHPPVNRHSIKYCWEQFRKNQFRLKINIETLYEMIGIQNISESQNNPVPVLRLSQQNHLCIIEPEQDKLLCETNPYYKYSFTSVDVCNQDNCD